MASKQKYLQITSQFSSFIWLPNKFLLIFLYWSAERDSLFIHPRYIFPINFDLIWVMKKGKQPLYQHQLFSLLSPSPHTHNLFASIWLGVNFPTKPHKSERLGKAHTTNASDTLVFFMPCHPLMYTSRLERYKVNLISLWSRRNCQF